MVFPSIPGVTLNHLGNAKKKFKYMFFEELLRGKCLFNVGLPGKFKYLWFKYMAEFMTQCFFKDPLNFKYYNRECSESIFI